MKVITVLTVLWIWLAAGVCAAGEGLDLHDDQVRLGYSIGYLVGGDFLSRNMELDPDRLLQGIGDGLTGNEPQLSPGEMKNTLVELQKAMTRKELGKVARKALKPQ